MALLAIFRRGAAACCRNIFQAERRFQHTAAAFDQFSGEELYSELPEEQLASAGSQALRTDTFVREVALTHYKYFQRMICAIRLPALHLPDLSAAEHREGLAWLAQAFQVLDYPERLQKLLVSVSSERHNLIAVLV